MGSVAADVDLGPRVPARHRRTVPRAKRSVSFDHKKPRRWGSPWSKLRGESLSLCPKWTHFKSPFIFTSPRMPPRTERPVNSHLCSYGASLLSPRAGAGGRSRGRESRGAGRRGRAPAEGARPGPDATVDRRRAGRGAVAGTSGGPEDVEDVGVKGDTDEIHGMRQPSPQGRVTDAQIGRYVAENRPQP